MKEVNYRCPECGTEWVEEQDEQDEWFGLGTDSTLCRKCSEKSIREVISRWRGNSMSELEELRRQRAEIDRKIRSLSRRDIIVDEFKLKPRNTGSKSRTERWELVCQPQNYGYRQSRTIIVADKENMVGELKRLVANINELIEKFKAQEMSD